MLLIYVLNSSQFGMRVSELSTKGSTKETEFYNLKKL